MKGRRRIHRPRRGRLTSPPLGRPGHRRRSLRGALALVALGGVGLGAAAVVTAGRQPPSVFVGTVPVTAVPAPTATPASTVTIAAANADVDLNMPTLGVRAPVVAASVGADGALEVPDDIATVGWWSGGASPGAPQGSIVIDGHVDSATQGRGAFFRLHDLRPADPVVITTGGTTLRYAVTGVRQYPKQALPADVFDQNIAARLVLISCGGAFDKQTRSYADNIVVYAVPST